MAQRKQIEVHVGPNEKPVLPKGCKSSPYSFQPTEYFKRYKRDVEIHNETQDKSYLFYAAPELRCTIESVLFYYLWALTRGKLSDDQKNLWRGTDLKRTILTIDPLFPYRMDFVELVAYYGKEFEQTVKPDFELLTTTWHQLGGFLHAEKTPLQPRLLPEDYWLRFASVLQQCKDNLALVLSQPFLNLSFTDEGNQLIEEYAKGNITREEVAKKLISRWSFFFKSVTQHIHDA